MKKLTILVFLLTFNFSFGQEIVGQLDDSLFISKDFFKVKEISYENISLNDIWFGIFPLSKHEKINRFYARFDLPDNVVLYDKIYLNGNKSSAGYNPVWAVKNKNKRMIQFDFTDEISNKRNRFFWFHLVPIFEGKGEIKVEYNYEYENGKKISGTIRSGEIVSKKPPIEKVIVFNDVDRSELRFYLKYGFDYQYYIKPEDNPIYELILEDPEGKEIKLNKNTFYVQNDNQNRLYKIKTGKIKVENTEWNVSGMSFVVNGKISEEISPVIATLSDKIQNVDLIGYDDMDIYTQGKIVPYKFSQYPSLLRVGLNIIKIRFKGGFHFIPVSINFFSRFSEESFWSLNILSEYEFNDILSLSFGGGMGYETSWKKMDILNNLLLYELGAKINLSWIWSKLNKTNFTIDFMLAHLSDAREAHISGVYTGLSIVLPTKLIY